MERDCDLALGAESPRTAEECRLEALSDPVAVAFVEQLGGWDAFLRLVGSLPVLEPAPKPDREPERTVDDDAEVDPAGRVDVETSAWRVEAEARLQPGCDGHPLLQAFCRSQLDQIERQECQAVARVALVVEQVVRPHVEALMPRVRSGEVDPDVVQTLLEPVLAVQNRALKLARRSLARRTHATRAHAPRGAACSRAGLRVRVRVPARKRRPAGRRQHRRSRATRAGPSDSSGDGPGARSSRSLGGSDRRRNVQRWPA